MFKFLSNAGAAGVRFCDRCASICDSRCRGEAIRAQQREQALLYGWRAA